MSEAMSVSFARDRTFEEISRELLRTKGEQPTLQRTTELAAQTITGCDACGISIRHRDRSVDTPACTSPPGREGRRPAVRVRAGPVPGRHLEARHLPDRGHGDRNSLAAVGAGRGRTGLRLHPQRALGHPGTHPRRAEPVFPRAARVRPNRRDDSQYLRPARLQRPRRDPPQRRTTRRATAAFTVSPSMNRYTTPWLPATEP